jgi:hypothetical protein
MEREGDSGDLRSAFLQPKREDAASTTARCKAAELNLTYRYHSTRIVTECRRGGFQLVEEGRTWQGRPPVRDHAGNKCGLGPVPHR